MSEIIPKEKILKNVRKGLLVPAPAPYGKIELESSVFIEDTIQNESYAIEAFLACHGTFFHACSSKFEFMMVLNKLIEEKGWKEPICFESLLTDLLNDNGIKTQVGNTNDNTPLLSTCHKIIGYPGQFVFDTRFQLLRRVLSSPILLMVAYTSQIISANSERTNQVLSPLDNFTKASIQAHHLSQKESYFFLINDTV
jgi:hypothetical protein